MDLVELDRILAAGEHADQRAVGNDEVVGRDRGPASARETDQEMAPVPGERPRRVFGHLGADGVVDHVDAVAAGRRSQRGSEWSASMVDGDLRTELSTELGTRVVADDGDDPRAERASELHRRDPAAA